MKYLPMILILWASAVSAQDVTLQWDANTESDLAGYRLYYGPTSENYEVSVDVGNVLTYKVEGLTIAVNYCFALTAYSTRGNESEFSEELCLNDRPDAPGGFRIIVNVQVEIGG